MRQVRRLDVFKDVDLRITGHQCLMPVILATQKQEIRRIAVQSQFGQIVHETLSQKNPSQKGLVEWLKV
jgi:hypothetical protein